MPAGLPATPTMKNKTSISLRHCIYVTFFTLLASVMVSTVNAVELPIRVITSDVTPQVATAAVTLPSSPAADSLYLKIHNIKFGGQVSIRINNGEWTSLYNDNVSFPDYEKSHMGIGGMNPTLRMLVPVDTADIVSGGSNNVQFRLNGTDGQTTAIRVLEFDFMDSTGTRILGASYFTQEDPALWTPPSSDPTDISAGQALWSSRGILKNDPITNVAIRASCADCHFDDGGDLKYFNYSNETIIARAQFHGLPHADGEQIASYIRQLDLGLPTGMTAPGRPWNPPFQPGPGTDPVDTDTQLEKDIKAAAWMAGRGLDAVADGAEDVINALMPDGTGHGQVAEVMDHLATLSTRETPSSVQFPDWNQWLPTLAPIDIWSDDKDLNTVRNTSGLGSLLSGANLKVNEAPEFLFNVLESALENGGAAALAQAGELNNTFRDFNNGITEDFYGVIRLKNPNDDDLWSVVNPGVGYDEFRNALVRWRGVKSLYLAHENDVVALQDAPVGDYSSANAPNYTPEVLSFPTWGVRGIAWTQAPHILGENINHFVEQEYEVGKTQSNQWYLVQQVLNTGHRRPTNMNVPLDWDYLKIHLHHAYEATLHEGLSADLLYTQIKMMQSRITGVCIIKQGFSMRTLAPNFFYSSNRLETQGYRALETASPGLWKRMFEEYLREFLFVVESENLSTMPRDDFDRHMINTASYVPNPWGGAPSAYFDSPNEDFAQSTYRLLPLLEQDGISPALLEDFEAFLIRAFPLEAGNWTGVPYWDTLLTPNNYLYLENHEDGLSDFAPDIMAVESIKNADGVNTAVANGIPRNGGQAYVGSRLVNVGNTRTATTNQSIPIGSATKLRLSSRTAFAFFAAGEGDVDYDMRVTFDVGGSVSGPLVRLNRDLFNEKFETYEADIYVPVGASTITEIRVRWIRTGTEVGSYGHGETFLDNVMIQDVTPSTDSVAPAAPTVSNVRTTNSSRTEVRINHTNLNDVSGFHVYRWEGGQTSNDAIRLTSTPYSSLYYNYYDESMERGRTYHYAATAVDEAGNESGFSNSGSNSVSSSLPDILPDWNWATEYTNNNLTIQWTGVSNVDLKGYDVWRKAEGETSFSLMNTVSEQIPLFYNDPDYSSSETYEYYVNPVTSKGPIDNSANVIVIKRLGAGITIEAEDYDAMSGIRTQATLDVGGGENVGWVDNGDWMDYQGIDFPVSGVYLMRFRVATPNSIGADIRILADGVEVGTATVSPTGGWQNWETISTVIIVPSSGIQTLRLEAVGGSGSLFNLNWLEIASGALEAEQLYASWATLMELTSDGVDSAYDGDPDRDGMANLLEYALGSDPMVNDAALFLPRSSVSTEDGIDYLNLTYRRRSDAAERGLSYVVGSGTDLTSGNLTTPTEEVESVTIDADFEAVTNRIPIDSNPRGFMRLKVQFDK